MVCHCSVPNVFPQPDPAVCHPAKAMAPPQRRQLALEALAGTETFSRLAPAECYWCKRSTWWRSIYGVVICAACHPPVVPELVAEWIGGEPGSDVETEGGKPCPK